MHFPFFPFRLLLGLLFFLHYQALADVEFIIPPDVEKYDYPSSTWTYIAGTQAYLQWTTDEREVDLYLLMRSFNRFELVKESIEESNYFWTVGFSEEIFRLDPDEENEFSLAIADPDTGDFLALSTLVKILPAIESESSNVTITVTVTSTVSRTATALTGTALREEGSDSGQQDKNLYLGLAAGLGSVVALLVAGIMGFACLRWRSARVNKNEVELRNFALSDTGVMIQQPMSRVHTAPSSPRLQHPKAGEAVGLSSKSPVGPSHRSHTSELSG
ncbi:hypothetical protein PV10_07368 [Exophiala mesophila]|uniref:Mid2 domain-containing protein n=1 Tax=Exophiala mesophila TaxID=212818 RepID=A0A0D1ZTD0_EXOME|nr:uncharacterized protein PV10_07368 [Exophiala mesophila]KIV90018.1 hypothetical protein PV10_07368 [Exophiala mesophila]